MNDLKARTKKFALDVIRLFAAFPGSAPFQIITRQLIRSATSVAANYRSACRGKSRADFINKLSIVEEEADESPSFGWKCWRILAERKTKNSGVSRTKQVNSLPSW